jgi:hypothetical protein
MSTENPHHLSKMHLSVPTHRKSSQPSMRRVYATLTFNVQRIWSSYTTGSSSNISKKGWVQNFRRLETMSRSFARTWLAGALCECKSLQSTLVFDLCSVRIISWLQQREQYKENLRVTPAITVTITVTVTVMAKMPRARKQGDLGREAQLPFKLCDTIHLAETRCWHRLSDSPER